MNTLLTITTEHKKVGTSAYVVVTLQGQIDENNLETFSKTIDGLTDPDPTTPPLPGYTYMMFELSKLEFINSKVIGYIASVHGRLSEQNKYLIFINPNESMRDILELVGLTQIVPTYETEVLALKGIEDGEVG